MMKKCANVGGKMNAQSRQGGSRQYLNYTFPVLPVSLTQFIKYVAFHEDFNELTMQFVS